ncbi:unnamed protein product [Albugo candida]|uniref:Uncharacterized protein n=1 Tax=Albugo candida TaxID=65357 RepID=A0A024G188_9STRA|nr:unnamed protein product [Albugo candida]|eukprot:CCI40622.1 unnamed protein product [Albugo candida]
MVRFDHSKNDSLKVRFAPGPNHREIKESSFIDIPLFSKAGSNCSEISIQVATAFNQHPFFQCAKHLFGEHCSNLCADQLKSSFRSTKAMRWVCIFLDRNVIRLSTARWLPSDIVIEVDNATTLFGK